MPLPMAFLLGVFVLVGLGALYVFGRRLATAWARYRGTRVVVCTTDRTTADLKRDQIASFGADPLIPHSTGSMHAVVEPLPGG